MNRAIIILTSCFLLTFLTTVSAMADAVSYAPTGLTASSVKAEMNNKILIKDVNIFDGVSEELALSMNVLIEGNKITKIAKTIPASDQMKIIEGGGRTLLPGFIEAHGHLQLNVGAIQTIFATADYLGALALYEAKNTLMRGFTTMRDVGGSVFGVKRAIDEGYFPGPRIYASGPPISMTAGHGDYRTSITLPKLNYMILVYLKIHPPCWFFLSERRILQ